MTSDLQLVSLSPGNHFIWSLDLKLSFSWLNGNPFHPIIRIKSRISIGLLVPVRVCDHVEVVPGVAAVVVVPALVVTAGNVGTVHRLSEGEQM